MMNRGQKRKRTVLTTCGKTMINGAHDEYAIKRQSVIAAINKWTKGFLVRNKKGINHKNHCNPNPGVKIKKIKSNSSSSSMIKIFFCLKE